MPTLLQMDIRFEHEKNMKAGGYTIIIMGVLLMLMLVLSWKSPLRQEPLLNEGIEVNLGNSETGLGDVPPMVSGDPAPEAGDQSVVPSPAMPPAETPLPTEEDNQADETIAVPPKVTNPQIKPTNNNTSTSTKTVVNPPVVAPPKPKATMGGYAGGNGTGGNQQDGFNNVRNQGIAGGNGDQGKANGNINSDNYKGNGGNGNSGVTISRGLTGRAIQRFPSFEDDFNENDKIAVDLRIDEAGKVLSATYQSRGSTSSNSNLKAIAIRKAMQIKFSAGEGESLGTVIFNFRLKD